MADAGEGPCRARLRSRVFMSAEVVSPRSQPMPRLTTRCGSVLASVLPLLAHRAPGRAGCGATVLSSQGDVTLRRAALLEVVSTGKSQVTP